MLNKRKTQTGKKRGIFRYLYMLCTSERGIFHGGEYPLCDGKATLSKKFSCKYWQIRFIFPGNDLGPIYLLRIREDIVCGRLPRNRNVDEIIIISLSHFSSIMPKIWVRKSFVNSQKYFPLRAFKHVTSFVSLFLISCLSHDRSEAGKSVECLWGLLGCGHLGLRLLGSWRRFDLAKIIFQNYQIGIRATIVQQIIYFIGNPRLAKWNLEDKA